MLKREFKINLKSLIIWSSILVFMLLIVFIMYPYLIEGDNIKMLDEVLASMPKELLSVFNMDSFSISTAYGWIKTEGYSMFTIFGSIYSAILGSSILSIEEKEKTIDFLSSKPITRNYIIKNKIICGVIYIFIFNLIVFLTNLIGLSISDELFIKELLLIGFTPLILYYMMFFISLLISTIINNPKKTTYIGLLVAFIPYMLNVLGSISDKLKILKQVSLFESVNITYLLKHMHINYIYLGTSVLVIIISIILTHKIYNNKELL